jgi:hypothetical protein
LASDDELTEGAIDIQVAVLRKNSGKDFVFCNVGLIDNESKLLLERSVSNVRSIIFHSKSLCTFDMVFNWGLPWPRLFARRIAFQKFGNYVAEHSSDLETYNTPRSSGFPNTLFFYLNQELFV